MAAAAIIVQADGADPRVFYGRFRIGTAGEAELRLAADRYVSVRHAVCYPDAGGWLIEDCGSVNGTWVNDVKAHGAWRLAKGDRVMIGHTVLTVVPA